MRHAIRLNFFSCPMIKHLGDRGWKYESIAHRSTRNCEPWVGSQNSVSLLREKHLQDITKLINAYIDTR